MGKVNGGKGCMIPESRAPRSHLSLPSRLVLWIRFLHYLDILFLGVGCIDTVARSSSTCIIT